MILISMGGSPGYTNVKEASESLSAGQDRSEKPEIRWGTCLEVGGEPD